MTGHTVADLCLIRGEADRAGRQGAAVEPLCRRRGGAGLRSARPNKGESLKSTLARTLAATSATAVAGALLATTPTTTAPAEAETARIMVRTAQQRQALSHEVVRTAKTRVGSRYVWGATGPRAFDCSGLVVWSYKKATGKTIPRTSYAQRYATKKIGPKNRQVGDLVFFNGNGHVAIYIGQNKIVHASNPSRGVTIDRISGWYRSTLVGYGRVILRK